QRAPEELPHDLRRPALRPVDAEVRALDEGLEVRQERPVEADGARDAERGERRAIEHGEPREVRRLERAHPAPLDRAHHALELLPRRLARAADRGAPELGAPAPPRLRHGPRHAIRSRRLTSRYRLISEADASLASASMQRIPRRRSLPR